MAEIRRSPVELGSFSHELQGFSTIRGGWEGFFQPSTELMKRKKSAGFPRPRNMATSEMAEQTPRAMSLAKRERVVRRPSGRVF